MSKEVVREAERGVVHAAKQVVDHLSILSKRDAARRLVFIYEQLNGAMSKDYERSGPAIELVGELAEILKELFPDWESFSASLCALCSIVTELRKIEIDAPTDFSIEFILMHEVSVLACNYWRAQKKFEAVIQNMEVQIDSLQTRDGIHDTPDEEIGQFIKRSMDAIGNLGEREFAEMTAKLDLMFISIEKLETYRMTRNKDIVKKPEAR
jgi:hypothetical protein